MRYGSINLSQGSLFWYHEALPSDAKQWSEGHISRSVPILFLVHNVVQMLELIIFYLKIRRTFTPAILLLTSFYDALMTFVSDQVTWRPLQPMLSTRSEHQGQNIRVRPVFLILTKTLDLLVFFIRCARMTFPRLFFWHCSLSDSLIFHLYCV